MTNHEYARLLLALPEVPIYECVNEMDTWDNPQPISAPVIRGVQDPILMEKYEQECKEKQERKMKELAMTRWNPHHDEMVKIRKECNEKQETVPLVKCIVI